MELKQIEINKINPNPFQPRMEFDKEELQELADNISKHGMIEPIVVTPKGDKFMIVAGERRWRANKLAKQDKIYAIIKNYDKDSDIKRDSLVENEMRENLSNEEFKSFVFSLAKSLGEPYFNKGFVDAVEITKYIMGNESRMRDLNVYPFYRRVKAMFNVERQGTTKLKKLVKENKVDLDTAQRIAGIEDKQVQDRIANMAETHTAQGIRQEVQRHNYQQKAREVTENLKKESDEEKIRKSEMGLVSKFCNKINGWNDSINYLSEHIKNNRQSFSKFSHQSRMDMLDALKPLKRDLEKALLLTTKLMEVLSK